MKKILPVLLLTLLPSVLWAQKSLVVSVPPMGKVEMRTVAGNGFVPMTNTVRQVQVGDQIRTGGGASVTLQLPDGSYMVVHENTTLTIKDFTAKPDVRSMVDLVVGRVRFWVSTIGGIPNPYRVQTPTALIAVRGTTFDVIVDELKNTEVRCLEGHVTVETAGMNDREVLLEAGRKTLVRPGEYPMMPVHIDDELSGNRVVRVMKVNPADTGKDVNGLPSLDTIMRDNDRNNRVGDRIQAPDSRINTDVMRAKTTLSFP